MTALTTVHKMTKSQRALVTVVVVVAAHAAVLALLATMKPIKLQRIEPPKPIEVKFVQLAPPPPPPPPPKPKPEPKPKEVKVVQQMPKPLPKPKPIIATAAVSTQPQVVVAEQPEPPPKVDLTPEPPPQPAVVKQAPKQPEIVQPKLVSSQQVVYIRKPNFEFDNDDLKQKARSIKLRLNVGADGKVDNVQVVQSTGLPALDARLQRAWQKAIFSPYKENGVAIPTYQFQEFTLDLVNE